MKRLVAFILFIFTATVCAACQPTPEKSAVQSKGDGEFEKALNNEPLEVSFEKVPSSIEDLFNAKDENVTIKVDAELRVPQKLTIPIKEYEQQVITQEMIKKACDFYIGEAILYKPDTVLTKQQIRDELKKVELLLNEDRLTAEYGNNESVKEMIREIQSKRYSLLSEFYKTAPEYVKKETSAFSFEPSINYINQAEYAEKYAAASYFASRGDASAKRELEKLNSVLNNGDGEVDSRFEALAYKNEYVYYVTASNSISKSNSNYGMSLRKCRETASDGKPFEFGTAGFPATNISISEDEAVYLAKQAVTYMGFEKDYALKSCELVDPDNEGEQTYFAVIYARQIANELITRDFFETYSSEEYANENHLRRGYGYEYIRFIITDEGIIDISVNSLLNELRTINNGVSIKEFDEIYEVFKKHSSIKYDDIVGTYEDVETGQISIDYAEKTDVLFDEVTLCTIRIVKKDDVAHYMIIPAWFFSGSIEYSVRDIDGGLYTVYENTGVLINAIDGSIISAEDCY